MADESIVVLPKITVTALGSIQSIYRIQAVGTAITSGVSAVTLPKIVAVGVGQSDRTGNSNEKIPAVTGTGTARTDTIATSAVTLLDIRASGVATTAGIGTSVQVLPKIQAAGIGITASAGVSVVTLRLITAVGVGRQVALGQVVTAENPTDDPQEAWAINYETNALYRYYRFPANAMCRFKGKTYVSNFAGIYEVTGDSDNGQKINSQITLPKSNFGDARNKRIPEVYLGVRSTGKMQLKVVANSDAARYYALNTGTDYVRGSRATIGKGLEANYWQLAVANIDGAPFALDSMEFSPLVLKRHGV